MTTVLQTVAPTGVATLTLNRPDRHNAFDECLIADLTAALVAAGQKADIRVVVLASTGRSFCAGADLGWMRRAAGYSEAENLADAAALATLLQTLDGLSKPTVALVQGPAYGGGVGLAACCDIAVASERASFRLSEVRLGLTPATISPYVVRAIGARQARRYFQTAETLSAADAHRLGLVHELTAPDGLAAAGERIVGELLQGAPGAQGEAKSLVALVQSGPVDAAMVGETSRRIARQRTGAEAREGMAAFGEKRPPRWSGRP